jgi:hypothetical protein
MADAVKPNVRIHAETGLKYLYGKKVVLFDNGVVIERELFDTLSKTPGAVRECLQQRLDSQKRKCGYDWQVACETGDLRKVKRKRRAEKAEEQPPKPPIKFTSSYLVSAVMTVVGIGSAIMSAYHTTMFLYQGGKPLWAALITGTMLILFSATAFTAARYFMLEKGALQAFGWFFVAAGAVIILYSIFSTVTVNFNQFQAEDDQRVVETTSTNATLASHERLITENKEALVEVSEEIASLEEEAEYWKTQSWRRYDAITNSLTLARERREELRQDGKRLSKETPDLVEAAAKSEDTVYTFLARLLGLPEDVAKFFVFVVPACLYDILSPFALSVVLLLMDGGGTRKRDDVI